MLLSKLQIGETNADVMLSKDESEINNALVEKIIKELYKSSLAMFYKYT